MLLAMDIGNTNIKTGLFEGTTLVNSWRLSVEKRRTADEYGVQMESFFHHLGLSTACIDGIIISSVIPSMNYTVEHMCSIYFPRAKPLFVHAELNTGLMLRYDHPSRLGSDRICNAVAACRLYGDTCITVDFGTATTFNVIADNVFLGGMICPGFKVSTNALIENTAMLPKVEYVRPATVIGQSTEHCIQSGILYGYVGQVEYLIKKVQQEIAPRTARVIGTGGMGELITAESDCIEISNPTLTLQGLAYLYELND